MALGDCTAGDPSVESGTLESHGIVDLHSTHWLHGGNAVAAFLDGGDFRLPTPAEFRARVLFSVSGVIPLLCRILACPELADSLLATSSGAQSVWDRHHFHGAVHVASTSTASARR